jgi:SSS family solute:Na+ symporter
MHLWQNLPVASTSSQFDLLGLLFGLGFILSFGYWCTDFVLMQRAFAARTDWEARQVPLLAGFGKLLFSALVILPGLIAARSFPALGHSLRFDQALPMLMKTTYGPTMLGVGLTALGSSLMTGLAGNVAAFSTLWTEDIYRTHLRKEKSDQHYILVGRLAVAFAILSCIIASYLNFLFGNLMEHVQMIFSVFGSPFFAIFVLGFCTRRTTARGALTGLGTGLGIGLLHLLGIATGVLHYGSVMNANFHMAIYTFTSTILIGWISSTSGEQHQPQLKSELLLNWRAYPKTRKERGLWILAFLLFVICLALNIIWQ